MSPDKNRPHDPARVRHMVEAIRLVMKFVKGRTYQEFIANDSLRSAAERQLEILGEASARISSATQAQWSIIPWKEIKRFRNLLAHEYFRTEYVEVWNIAQNLLPDLLPLAKDLFADLDQKFGPDTRV